MHSAIGAALAGRDGEAGVSIPILYGGSVNSENVASIMALRGVSGVLVGGASLRASSFVPIITAARLKVAA